VLAGKNKELQKILILRKKGKISEAAEKLAEFEEKIHRNEINIRTQIIKATFISPEQTWETGLEIIESVISKCDANSNPLLLIDAYYVKAQCLLQGEQYKKSNTLVEETEKFLEEKLNSEEDENKLRKAWLLLIKGYNYNMMGENKLAREAANHGLTLAKTLTDSEIQLSLYELLGINEYQIAEYEESIVYLDAGLQLAKEVKNSLKEQLFCFRLAEGYGAVGKADLALKYCDLNIDLCKKHKQDPKWMLLFKAITYWNIGELEKSVKLYKEVLPTFEEETGLWSRANLLRIKAYIELQEGSLDQAIEYITEAIDLVKKRDDVFRSTILSILLANMLFNKGEFETVLELCFSNLDALKRNKNPYFQADIFETMGVTFHVKGNYNLALEYVQKSLKSWKKFNTPNRIATSLFYLVNISIDKDDKVLYTKYLTEFEAFVEKHPTNLFNQMYQTIQALVLKTSSRPRDWMKAVDILIKVVNEKLTKYGFALVALINLCELLMNEFSISGDAQVLQELEFYVEELSEQAKMQNVRHLRLEANNLQILTHWLKAQKSMVEIDLQKAKALLDNTRKIADEEGMLRLAEKLTQQQEKLLGQLSQWDDFIRKYYEFIKE